MDNKKLNILSWIFIISFWMIFFTWEGNFNIQALIPLITLSFFLYFSKNKILKLNSFTKPLFFLLIITIVSTALNSVIHSDVYTKYNIIGIFYFIFIFIWFVLNVNNFESGDSSNNIRIQKYAIISYIIVSTIMSLFIIRTGLTISSGKVTYINFIGTKIDSNLSSAFISFVPLYILNWLLNSDSRKYKKILVLLILVINVLAVIISGSRASFLGLFISLLLSIIIFFLQKSNSIQRIKRKIFVLVIFLISGVIAIYYFTNYMSDWLENRYFKTSYVDFSNKQRLSIWNNAITGIIKQPILGYGYGTYSYLEDNKYNALRYPTMNGVPAHNTYLDIAIYGGFIGLILFIVILIRLVIIFIKRKELRKYLPIIFNLLFISMIIGADRSVLFWNNILILYNFYIIDLNRCDNSK